MNQNDQMREALQEASDLLEAIPPVIEACEKVQADIYETRIKCQQALAAEPAKLVRLQRRDIMRICEEAELEYRQVNHRNMADIVAVKVMDAMIAKNGGVSND